VTSQITPQMTGHGSQTTAPNLRIEAANGVTYAYRRFGNTETAALPLVFFVHFRANLDNWDPLLVDTIARQREVILLDNTGVAGSTGTTPGTVEAMALDAIAFTDALALRRYDLLGFSLGGFVAQEVALIRPHQARRIVLAGTGPRAGRDMHVFTRVVLEIAVKDASVAEDLLTIFFEQTATSQARGREFINRLGSRREDRDAPVSLATRDAHLSAIETWGIPDPTGLNRLAGVTQPTLLVNGDNDIMVPTENTYLLADHLPNARLSIYPDAGHGFLFQYPVEFGTEVNAFLGQ
jgi:pimeloyl-ACP methyl ester carboxylesterase